MMMDLRKPRIGWWPTPCQLFLLGMKITPRFFPVGSRRHIFEVRRTFVDVSAGERERRIVHQIDEHGELLDEDVGMRLEPESRRSFLYPTG